jgi:hypothetical protein
MSTSALPQSPGLAGFRLGALAPGEAGEKISSENPAQPIENTHF